MTWMYQRDQIGANVGSNLYEKNTKNDKVGPKFLNSLSNLHND
jgi:hypothetical protein